MEVAYYNTEVYNTLFCSKVFAFLHHVNIFKVNKNKQVNNLQKLIGGNGAGQGTHLHDDFTMAKSSWTFTLRFTYM